jgi:ParB family chromosome partitioning protein
MTEIMLKMLPVTQIEPNPEQPRRIFDQSELTDLSKSIKTNGLIQAISVEGPYGDKYYIIDGERRWRATKLAMINEIRAEIHPATSDQVKRLQLALVANVQRSNLLPSEEAMAFQRLKEMGYSNNDIAIEVGVSSAHVVARLRMLKLGNKIMNLIDSGRLQKDPHLIDALLEIEDQTVMEKIAVSLANRSANVKSGVEACKRVMEHLRSEKILPSEIPAMIFTQKKAVFSRPIYDAQAALGRVPPWPLVEISMRETCDACGLRDVASVVTCKGCAMVEILVRMIGGTVK